MSLWGMFTRRSLLAAASLPILSRNAVAQTPFKISNKNVSAGQPIPFSTMYDHPLTDKGRHVPAILRYCTEIIDGNKMSFELIEKARGKFDFAHTDAIIAFANDHKMRMKSSHLIWGASTPKWVNDITTALDLEREMHNYIYTLLSRYRGRFYNHIVVNEAIEQTPITPRDMRPTIFQKLLGENHVAIAFKIAALADPQAELMYNDYGVETTKPEHKMKLEALKRLIYSLKDRGVKIDAVGLQSHLYAHEELNRDGLTRFAEDMLKAKVNIHISELDCDDVKIRGTIAERDLHCARHVYTYIDTINQVQKVKSITCLSLSDSNLWSRQWYKNVDGSLVRGFPLDDNYQPKPMMRVIDHFCKGAQLVL
jgi:endo-1,4-beta-xylanase